MHSNAGHQMALNGQLHALGALFPGKATVLPLGRRRNGFQSWSGCYSEKSFQLSSLWSGDYEEIFQRPF